MMGTPLTCSLLLVNNKKHLLDSFNNDADYLYQTNSDDYNLGKVSFQCGRRNDALKFWSLWKAVGTNGLAKIVDHLFETANVAREYIRKNPDYKLYNHENSLSREVLSQVLFTLIILGILLQFMVQIHPLYNY